MNKRFSSITASRVMMIVIFVLVSVAYLYHVWGHELASWEGDELIYILTAEYLSPWTDPSEIASHMARNSKFPPLFPLILGLVGGGGSIVAANIVTAILMTLSFVMIFFWLLEERLTEWKAFALVFLFALLPGTYMQALFVSSEGLYLILSFGCLLAVVKAENSTGNFYLIVAALCIAAATLTRSAGWALFVAFAFYLMWHRRPSKKLLLTIAALPALAWAAYKGITGGNDTPSYFTLMYGWYSSDLLAVSLSQLTIEPVKFLIGLVGDFTIMSVGTYALCVVAFICIAATVYRIYLRRLDGIYVAVYYVMIVMYPLGIAYIGDKRFALVIVPILIFQTLFLIGRLTERMFGCRRFNPVEAVFLLSILLLALPAFALAIARHQESVSPELESFRRAGWWYSWYAYGNFATRYEDMKYAKVLTEGLPTIAKAVPHNECLYSVKPYIVGFYMHRASKFPPAETVDEARFNEILDTVGCRYFLFTADISPSVSENSFYPMYRLDGRVQLLAEAAYGGVEGRTVVGVLGRRRPFSKK